MLDFLQTILAFIVALGLLVTIHEYGHYQVARSLGIRILKFSVGFGPALWSTRRGVDQTEFAVCAIPLVGYVKMLDEREAPVAPEELHRAFNTQTVGRRMAVVVAGPLANFVLAVALYWLMFMAGVTGPRPIIGEVTPNGVAATAGLRVGDEILAVDGRPTVLWDSVMSAAVDGLLDGRRLEVEVRHADGTSRLAALDFEGVSVDDFAKGKFFEKLGFKPRRQPIPPLIGKVVPGEAAATAGLRAGDLLQTVNGEPLNDWVQWVERVRASPGKTLQVGVLRDGQSLTLSVVPQSSGQAGQLVGRIGAEVARPESVDTNTLMATERYTAVDALGRAMDRTANVSVTSLKFMHRMLVGEASTSNLSGPISIAQFAGASARMGLSRFLEFMALVSVSLAVLNLLPVPLLDGGHLMYYALEAIMRRPLPERVQVYGQHLGLMVLMGLMGIALFNDVVRSIPDIMRIF